MLDTHQHFWALARGGYDWLTPDLKPLYQDFGPDLLRPLLDREGIDSTILVQAAPNIEESLFLLGIAGRCDFVKGVVGWIDFESPAALDQLERLADNPGLKGLRPMVQDIIERDWLQRPEFTPIFERMIARRLGLDALVRSRQLPQLLAFAERYPDLPIVLDHGGKPDIARGAFADWAADIARLAALPMVHCKLSGLWTEAGADRSRPNIGRYVEHLLHCFGPNRLMWGSDWPVVLMAGGYGDWLAQCRDMLAPLDDSDRGAIFERTGKAFYGLD